MSAVEGKGRETREDEPRGDEGGETNGIFFAVCGAAIGFAIFYALPIYARLAKAYYDPIGRRWFWADHAPPIPMGYVGQIAWAVGGALVCGGVAFVASARVRASDRSFALWSAWALTALAIVAAYFTWNNWP